MKKFKILAIMLMVATLVSGCSMKTDFGIKIKADKQISIGAIMAMDDDLIDTMLSMDNLDGDGSDTSSKHTDKERWAYIEEAFKDSENEDVIYEKYEEGKYKGYKLNTPSADIDLFTKSSASSKLNFANYFDGEGDNDSPIMFVKDGDYYVSNITFDSSSSESFGQMTDNASSFEFFEFKFVISLPVVPVSNNADSVSSDGKTLTWDLTKGAKDIDFKFSFAGAKDTTDNNNDDDDDNSLINSITDNSSKKNNSSSKKDKEDKKDNTLIYIIAAACGGAVLAGAVVLVLTKKKKTA